MLDLFLAERGQLGPERDYVRIRRHIQAFNLARGLRLHQTRLDTFDQVWSLLLHDSVDVALEIDQILERGILHHDVGEWPETVFIHEINRRHAIFVRNKRH